MVLFYLNGTAQTQSDQLLIPAKNVAIRLQYDHGSFTKYWEGTTLRSNPLIGTVTHTVLKPAIVVGLSNKLNVYTELPYMTIQSKEPNGGHLDNTYGLQDLSMGLKYELLNRVMAENELSLLAAIGGSIKLGQYAPDNGHYSMGHGAPQASIRGIALYTVKQAFYLRGSGAFLLRGKAPIYRDSYYYKDRIIYSDKMEVPNAVAAELATGIWAFNKALRAELQYNGLRSLSGDDIRPYAEPKPANKLNYDKLGAMAQYYFTRQKNMAVMAHYDIVIHGRNTAMLSNYGAGFLFKFGAY